ncbi:TIGR02646 family protein [Clostridium botulinum]|nr:TIGR02646 family protein [Clostridium botulinum]NFG40382.1 TIGR02646 family protein [Clostridium botulinum]
MHKVKRNKAPLKLIEKDKKWRDLLKEDVNLQPDWAEFSKTVAKKETIAALEEMYKGCCCYCESKIKSTSYPEIEHFKPKIKYPKLCFNYKNLHYSCKRCNIAKGSVYNEKLINPSDENPEEYIRYIGELAVSIDNNERGIEMINLVKLNERLDLKEERIRYLNEFSKNYELLISAIETILNNKNSKDITIVKPFIINFIENIKIKSKHGESYSTMIKHNFSDKLDVLMNFLGM